MLQHMRVLPGLIPLGSPTLKMRKVVGGIDRHRVGLNGVSRFQITKIMYELAALLRMLCKHRLLRGGRHQHLPDLVSAPGTACLCGMTHFCALLVHTAAQWRAASRP